jgi:hypothetical protein
MSHPQALFLNVEPDALELPVPVGYEGVLVESTQKLRIIVEITERVLAQRPALLLQAVSRIRELGAGVAVDDVGADDRSLAIMPFLRPDVIKLDLRLIQERTSSEIVSVSQAVSAHIERTGAKILAEGIETSAHLRTALSLGATLGQGWLFGRPGPLPQPLPTVEPWDAIALLSSPPPVHLSQTPFEMLHGTRDVLAADPSVLLSMSRHLEDQAKRLDRRGMILASVQSFERVTPWTLDRYLKLAERGAFVGICGKGASALTIPGIALGEIADEDRLRNEWAVVVIGPYFAAGLAALETRSDGPSRNFAFCITHDRELVVRMGHSLLARLDAGIS